MNEIIQFLAIAALPVLLAITLHEAAHGYAALRFGDPTAAQLGRISLNPLRHIDLVGTVLVPLSIVLLSGASFLFGWAKPVPVDFGRLRRPKHDMRWVAAAGPLANLAMAIGWALLFKFAAAVPDNIYTVAMERMADVGININLALLVLNLLPLPPLDGGRIVVSLLPMRQAIAFSRLERWGFPILLLLMFSGLLGSVMWPLMNGLRFLFAIIFNFQP